MRIQDLEVSDGPWEWATLGEAGRSWGRIRAAVYVAWMVLAGRGPVNLVMAGDRTVAITGNGNNSADHARFIVGAFDHHAQPVVDPTGGGRHG